MHNSFNDPTSTQDQNFAILNTIKSFRFKSNNQHSNKKPLTYHSKNLMMTNDHYIGARAKIGMQKGYYKG
jgi:hypothetical protein